MSFVEAWAEGLAAGVVQADAAQGSVAQALASLELQLAVVPRRNGVLTRLRGAKAVTAPRGLYIHGPVGRGKTMLMDLFFNEVAFPAKRRAHFHGFMQDIHGRLHRARQRSRDAIAAVATDIADETRLLCLDEMQITDIADAMIVGRLFTVLFQRGLVLVTTSNIPPDALYRHGLNRQLFSPFITLLYERLSIMAIDDGVDYRLGRVKAHETFITPLGPTADDSLADLWARLTDGEAGGPEEIEILGRQLKVPHAAHGCARFTFADLCEAPLGPADYLAIAGRYRVVFVEKIPALAAHQRNEARRFVILIDTLYDARVRLVASSALPPEAIYGGDDHRFELARTVSRLKEMQSASWWGKKIAET
jgi:cell division protein ZapE